MEVANLVEQRVDITAEWFQLDSDGVTSWNIVHHLENKYRIHSDKKVITCDYCNQPGIMVLRMDAPHFRHISTPCPSAQIFDGYTNRIKRGEGPSKHRAILRTYLEGQLRLHAVVVQGGYMSKVKRRMTVLGRIFTGWMFC